MIKQTLKRNRVAAAYAVQHVDVDLGDPPPEGIARRKRELPFEMTNKRDVAKISLSKRKDRRGGASGASLQELDSAPDINALSFAIRYLPGGRQRFLEFVKLAALNGDPAAELWWRIFADLPQRERVRVNYDDVCKAAGIKPSALIAGIVGHGMEAATDMGNLVAAALHPEVIAAAGKSALRISGPHADIAAEDRKQLLQARGFLPVPKGASIHLHANASANAQAAAAASTDPSVPKFSQDIAALAAPRGAVQKQIAAEAPASLDIETEAVFEPVER